ncbi:MAG: hypothetical protein A3D31_03025 [Candidatus Fluviicola riflensis]|nr:MAG: hypothetical protein CHH17_12015 [Candidatus Fluviicola riflensis]OGS78959.1 MAG: hypothetical protein A3D31_03025 [Candidatus Fluviicola riflensis]OGS85981.1 MAG: hypothetical protein A3E30_10510 [Fluviicola sp. RIFCSPHIGHO2_12_FULL_43_24]OGS86390.1 MAG: hypothetical protein A2724_02480 [Fluviicola sp. RIFCSPHIGHO2_01_FULL_43_53]
MTAREALVYLSVDTVEEADDAYETQLFELKQHFLTKPVLFKTAEGKLKRLAQLQTAYEALGGNPSLSPIPVVSVDFPVNFMESFSEYHARRNQLKQTISGALDAQTVIGCVNGLIELERGFIKQFENLEDWSADPVVIGTEPDVMLMQQQLKEQTEKGITTLELLYMYKNNLPNELLLALKRLSLLQNYLYP